MAAWRRHALSLFPELHDDIEREASSAYSLFFFILPFARDAHQRGDDDALRRVYGFAQWCHHQRQGSELPNAVGVAFYEHLFDDWSLHAQIAPWLSPHVTRDAWPLWQARLDEPKLAELRRLLDERSAPRWRELRDVVPD
jgi:hypothetical protein